MSGSTSGSSRGMTAQAIGYLPGRGNAQRVGSLTPSGAPIRVVAVDTLSAIGLLVLWVLVVFVVVMAFWKRR